MTEVEEFLRDTAEHAMSIRLDQGVYRHLLFKKEHCSNHWFEIITWPGALTINGDMGTWTFSRVEDMFKFFRDEQLRVNKNYWAEKLRNGQYGGRENAKVFSEDLFREQLLDHLKNHYEWTEANLSIATQALHDDVLTRDNKYELLIAARDFSCRLPTRNGLKDSVFHFDTCELPSGEEYSYHFVWCLYAIVWGIQEFDAVQEANAQN